MQIYQFSRVISLGDVIALQGQYFPEYTQDISEGVHMRLPLICYKVNKILPVIEGATSYLANSLVTSVYQVRPCITSTFSHVWLHGAMKTLPYVVAKVAGI